MNTGAKVRALLRDWGLVPLVLFWAIGARTDIWWPMFAWFVADGAYCVVWDVRHGRKF